MCGTPHYMAPELVIKKDYCGMPADIWALGVILYIILTGKAPFNGSFEDDLYRRIQKGKYKFSEDIQLTKQCKNIISKMLCVNPNKRISASELISEPWICNT